MNGYGGKSAMGGRGDYYYDPRNPVTIEVSADPGAQQCFQINLRANEKGLVSPQNGDCHWELQLDAVKEMLEKMGVNFNELKPFNFMRSCGFPANPDQREQREGFEVIQMDSHYVVAGNGVKFEFRMDKLIIEEGKPVGRHSHGKNVVFEIYFYQEAPFHADVCAFGEAHESRPGMRHVIALKMILCK